MSKTPVTDRVVGRLRAICKSAGYNVPTAKQVQLMKAAALVEEAKKRIIAKEFEKLAFYKRKLRELQKKANKTKIKRRK